MRKSTQEKLLEAIQKYNESQTDDADKMNEKELFNEIGYLDNEGLETAAKRMNNVEKRETE